MEHVAVTVASAMVQVVLAIAGYHIGYYAAEWWYERGQAGQYERERKHRDNSADK